MNLARPFFILSAALLASATAILAAPAAAKQPLLKKVGEHHLLHARQGAAAVVVGDFIYIAAGSSVGAITDIERFNVRTGAIDQVYNKLLPRRYHNAIDYEGKIYLFGGQGYLLPGQPFEATVEIYDIATRTVTFGTKMPSPRSNMGAVRLGSKVCLIGGMKMRNESEIAHAADMDIYDLATNQWSTGPAMPGAREAPAVLVSGFVVVPGGYRGRSQSAEVAMFVPRENVWKTLPALSRKVSSHSLARLDPFLFLFGDYADLDLVLAYDLRNRTTIEVIDHGFRGARHSAAVVHEGRIYVIGGNTNTEGGERDLIQVFTLNQGSS